MTSLVVIGPYLTDTNPGWPGQYGFTFLRGDVSPVVGTLYHAVFNAVRGNAEIDVSFPVASPNSDPRALWVQAIRRLASADAVFAIFDAVSEAIPLEAALARQMDLPVLVAAMETGSAALLRGAAFPVVDAQLGPYAVEEAVRALLDQVRVGVFEVTVTDSSDADFWRDVDDEGVGGRGRAKKAPAPAKKASRRRPTAARSAAESARQTERS